MATKKSGGRKQSSSGSDPKSKRIVKGKMQKTMDEFKHHQLSSGRSGKKVTNPKQAIAIGLSEARQSGARIPKKGAAKKSATKKTTAKSSSRKSTAKKSASKTSSRKTAGKSSRKK
jgi:uncharacterized protein DUF6496